MSVISFRNMDLMKVLCKLCCDMVDLGAVVGWWCTGLDTKHKLG